MHLASKIKEWRQGKDLSQAQAAEELGVRQPTFCRWESGKSKPDSESLVKLSKAMACSVDELLACESVLAPELSPTEEPVPDTERPVVSDVAKGAALCRTFPAAAAIATPSALAKVSPVPSAARAATWPEIEPKRSRPPPPR